ncbi:unnamed protein product [Musa acuminata subsp. malaccensis]|uniref:(wild Malaysian banana) hypothetical protein n=1 Tax=Musa acuminata subsp. malaccensis TaxID=214687 RepID=A0A804JA22_MUSAM|nr:PREDICTED: pentatricopeptide repeat-containing protein At4g14170 [Musa acuminata subsp. malaccensis]CAG1840456.1 unnamed protein product [Musa acuminata subsp. malaccensis]
MRISMTDAANLLSYYFHLLHISPSLRHLRHLHARLLRTGLFTNVILSSKLLLSYSRRRRLLPCALSVFLHMPRRNSHSWNTLIAELSRSGRPLEAIGFFHRMRSSGVPVDEFTFPPVLRSCAGSSDAAAGMSVHGVSVKSGVESSIFVASALVFFYMALSRTSDARQLFDGMPEKDAVLWTSMLSGYAQNGDSASALAFFRKMVDGGLQLDHVVLVSLLLACGQSGSIRHGKSAHACCVRRGLGSPLTLCNALVDMYVKSGDFGAAERVFHGMPARDVISWTALILGHGLNGHADVALKLFDEMCTQGIQPNSVTFLGVLSACGHGGLVEKAWGFFGSMRQCGIEPELKHYACVADALAKAGRLVEAERFVAEMPMEPDEAILGALLAGCRVHGDTEVGDRVSKRLMRMRPAKSGYYMSLANMYADAGRYSDAERVREFMKERSVNKQIGYSSVDSES